MLTAGPATLASALSRWATVRKADPRPGTGWSKKPMPAAERQQDSVPSCAALLQVAGRGNWPDTALCAGPERAADVGQVSLWGDDDGDAGIRGQVGHR